MRSLWLMYHDVYDSAPAAGVPSSANVYHVSADVFRSHLEVIEQSGLRVLSAGQFLANPAAPQDTVVLTFDDGWHGAFEVARPLLLQRGWKATFFVTRNFVGRSNFCTPEILRQAAADGMEIGVHGVTHRMLSACTREEVVQEFRGCKDYLEDVLGRSVDHASIPGGDLTPTVAACAREAGMKSLANSRPGVNRPSTSAFDLRRVAMKDATSIEDLQRLCQFNLGRERARWTLLQLPRSVLGMKRYSKLRRALLRTRHEDAVELFKP